MPPNIPKEGFLKLTRPEPPRLSPEQRAALVRQADELLRRGDLAQAKRIFFTVGDCEGMSRVGEALLKRGDVLESLRLFILAGNTPRVTALSARMAQIVRHWLRSDE